MKRESPPRIEVPTEVEGVLRAVEGEPFTAAVLLGRYLELAHACGAVQPEELPGRRSGGGRRAGGEEETGAPTAAPAREGTPGAAAAAGPDAGDLRRHDPYLVALVHLVVELHVEAALDTLDRYLPSPWERWNPEGLEALRELTGELDDGEGAPPTQLVLRLLAVRLEREARETSGEETADERSGGDWPRVERALPAALWRAAALLVRRELEAKGPEGV